VTARHWTSRHRDDLLTRVTVLTAGTAVLGAVGATGLAVGMVAATPPKATVVAVAAPTDAATTAAADANATAAPTSTRSRAASSTRVNAAPTKTKATPRATKAATPVKAAPVVTKKAITPPAPKPKPTAASGGS
jgi:hypothetical protein